MTTATTANTECSIIAGYQLLYDQAQGKCIFPQLYNTGAATCATTR